MLKEEREYKIKEYDGKRFYLLIGGKSPYYYSRKSENNGITEKLCIYKWKKEVGLIPKGYVIHHLDENKENDDINNLICISPSDHSKIHASNRMTESFIMKGKKRGPMSDETKKKISDSKKGHKQSREWCEAASKRFSGEGNPFYGKHHTKETKAKLSKSRTGVKIGPMSDEQKRKISEAQKGKKRGPMSDEAKKNMSNAHKGKIPWNKGKKYKLIENNKSSLN